MQRMVSPKVCQSFAKAFQMAGKRRRFQILLPYLYQVYEEKQSSFCLKDEKEPVKEVLGYD
jgi:hypothetical protein